MLLQRCNDRPCAASSERPEIRSPHTGERIVGEPCRSSQGRGGTPWHLFPTSGTRFRTAHHQRLCATQDVGKGDVWEGTYIRGKAVLYANPLRFFCCLGIVIVRRTGLLTDLIHRQVMLCRHLPTRYIYAVKVVPKAKLSTKKMIDQLMAELNIMM